MSADRREKPAPALFVVDPAFLADYARITERREDPADRREDPDAPAAKRAKWVSDFRAASEFAVSSLDKSEVTKSDLTQIAATIGSFSDNFNMRLKAYYTLEDDFKLKKNPDAANKALKLINQLAVFVDNASVLPSDDIRYSNFQIKGVKYSYEFFYEDGMFYKNGDWEDTDLPRLLLAAAGLPVNDFSLIVATVLLESLITGGSTMCENDLRKPDFPKEFPKE